jgi:hypothetical protein
MIDESDRLVMEIFDADGNLVERSVGPSEAEEKEAHDKHECTWLCGYCYEEMIDYLEEQKSLQLQ